ncbi:MAG: MFS transporter, partial [Actinobacteria bacterium]|nr:MFS transporter [Actinomycetota bacterium]
SALVLLFVGLLTIGTWNVPVGLFVGTAIFAAGQALAFPALMTIAVAATPPAERSSVVGTFSAFADVGFAVGALGLGGVATAAGYEAVFIVGALSSVAGALLLARIPTATPRVRRAEAA